MYIIAEYSHKGGKDFVLKHHFKEFKEVKQVINQVDAGKFKTKKSRSKAI